MKYLDQIGHRIILSEIPKRIISLVPSQTEFLLECGLADKLIGRTKFCVHPEKIDHIQIIGGTKNLRFETIKSLKPDFIVANKEENNKEDIDLLKNEFPVYVSDVKDCNSAFQMMNDLSEILDLNCNSLIDQIMISQRKLYDIKKELGRALYVIWKDPYMAAGNDTFINYMLEEAGFDNAINLNRYPELTIEEIQKLKPEFVLLSSEPYPFKKEHLEEITKELPDSKVMLVDGEAFSWYGSRMIYAYDYIRQKFHV